MIERSDWYGYYKQGWGKGITKDSYDHPAKVRYGLSGRIYKHMVEEEGWLDPGDFVLDPFAGIAGFGFHAMACGLNWVGVELEPRFVEMGTKNINMWEQLYYPVYPKWGTAQIIQGDSRNLVNILSNNLDVKACVSSPPFVSTSATGGWQMLGKYADRGVLTVAQVKGDKSKSYPSWDKERDTSYGDTEGQLASMKDVGFDAAVSSPPFCDSAMTTDKKFQAQVAKDRRGGSRLLGGEYGETAGQMGNMGDEGFDAAVSSPPFLAQSGGTNVTSKEGPLADGGLLRRHRAGNAATEAYGEDDSNLGNMMADEDSFWSASRRIIEQTYEVLRPGGHAIWVCKRFVRKGKLVYFPRMWAKVCVAAGFKIEHWHRAWVIEEKGAQYDLFGNLVKKQIHRSRMAEKKGSPPINWEDVICMVKE